MGNATASLKVTYHKDTAKIDKCDQDAEKLNKYFNIVPTYQEMYDKILANAPFSDCSEPLGVRLLWIDNSHDEILLGSQEDYDIFMTRTSTLEVRHIHATMVKPDASLNQKMLSD